MLCAFDIMDFVSTLRVVFEQINIQDGRREKKSSRV